MFDPLIDKKPYGAAVYGSPVEFSFSLPEATGVERVFLVVRGSAARSFELERADGEPGKFRGTYVPDEWGILHYRFEGRLSDGGIAFFGRGADGRAVRGDWLPEWQLTVTKESYKVPDWAQSGVIYQIFADRFAKGGNRPFLKRGRLHRDWNELPDVPAEGRDYAADDFFGGDAEGIISRLDYLSSLGVTCIYLSPIFESSSNHRYDTGDYLKIDGLFGDEESFGRLVADARARGIRVILDGVFNHTGADSLYFNKFGSYPSVGAYQSRLSPYSDWFYFYDFPDGYHCWWGSTVVPTVNKSAEGFRKLLLGENGVVEKWSAAGVAGWRLDVVDELPTEFVDALTGKIRSVDPDALIIGEVWEDASVKESYGLLRPYFTTGELDGVMNYPFKNAILDFVSGGSPGAFRAAVTPILENYPKQCLDACMTLLGSHDTRRALTRLGCSEPPPSKAERSAYRMGKDEYAAAVKRLKLAAVLQYALPGVPCVYYGDEAGTEGFEDPMNRAPYPWGREDKELLAHYRKLGELRRRFASLLRGETRFIDDERLLVFDRRPQAPDSDGNSCLRVAVNPSGEAVDYAISAFDAFSGEKSEVFKVPAGGFRVLILR